jgi:AAA domain
MRKVEVTVVGDLPANTDDAERSYPVDLTELLRRGSQRPRFAIPQFAPRGQITVLFGDVGTGKSTLMGSAAVANENGEAFLGLYPFEEPQQIVIFDWENGAQDYVTALARQGLVQPRGLYYYDGPDDVNLDTEEGRLRLTDIIHGHKATLAVFDSMADAFPHTEELDGKGIRQHMTATRELAVEMNVAVVLISHEPKADHASATMKLAGHGMWARKVDQMWRLKSRADHHLLEHVKHRTIGRRRPVRITLQTEGDLDIGPMRLVGEETDTQSERDAKAAAENAVVEDYLRSNGPTQKKDIIEAMKPHGFTKYKVDRVLESSDQIVRVKTGVYDVRREDVDG